MGLSAHVLKSLCFLYSQKSKVKIMNFSAGNIVQLVQCCLACTRLWVQTPAPQKRKKNYEFCQRIRNYKTKKQLDVVTYLQWKILRRQRQNDEIKDSLESSKTLVPYEKEQGVWGGSSIVEHMAQGPGFELQY